MSGSFVMFLEFFTFFTSIISVILVYLAIRNCRESAFVPIYYLIGFSVASVGLAALSQVFQSLSIGGIVSLPIFHNLMLSYTMLFLFGSLWQSYEASICVPSFTESSS